MAASSQITDFQTFVLNHGIDPLLPGEGDLGSRLLSLIQSITNNIDTNFYKQNLTVFRDDIETKLKTWADLQLPPEEQPRVIMIWNELFLTVLINWTMTPEFQHQGSLRRQIYDQFETHFSPKVEGASTVRHLLVFFDGTGNSHLTDEVMISWPTNVLKMFLCLHGQLVSTNKARMAVESSSTNQRAIYFPGVGSSGTDPKYSAVSGLGIFPRIIWAWLWLSRYYHSNSKIVIVGFSRGSYAARILADIICQIGLLPSAPSFLADTPYEFAKAQKSRKQRSETFQLASLKLIEYLVVTRQSTIATTEMWDLHATQYHPEAQKYGTIGKKLVNSMTRLIGKEYYNMKDSRYHLKDLIQQWKNGTHEEQATLFSMHLDTYQLRDPETNSVKLNCSPCKVAALALWDTVGSIGSPLFNASGRIDQYRWTDERLDPRIKRCFHAVALEEQRVNFTPLLISQNITSSSSSTSQIEQQFFPGCHADVGGGYPCLAKNRAGVLREDRTSLSKDHFSAEEMPTIVNSLNHESGLSDIALAWMIAKLSSSLNVDFADGVVRWAQNVEVACSNFDTHAFSSKHLKYTLLTKTPDHRWQDHQIHCLGWTIRLRPNPSAIAHLEGLILRPRLFSADIESNIHGSVRCRSKCSLPKYFLHSHFTLIPSSHVSLADLLFSQSSIIERHSKRTLNRYHYVPSQHCVHIVSHFPYPEPLYPLYSLLLSL